MERAWVLVLAAACAHASPEPRATHVVHPYYVNFVPFGAGQFQNDQPAKGAAIAIGEGATAGASIAIWTYLLARYGVTDPNVPAGDATRVRALEQIEIGTGIAAIALYGYGVVDSLLYYRPRVRVAPLVVPGGGGAVLVWSR